MPPLQQCPEIILKSRISRKKLHLLIWILKALNIDAKIKKNEANAKKLRKKDWEIKTD
jgi:hypothetical protein